MSHADSFERLYREIHDGREPFAWQTRAAVELCTGEVWAALAAPTGTGKTTLVDCWLYARSQRDDLPRRLFWVVDRRGVVDQVARYTEDVLSRLASSPRGSAAHTVNERLRYAASGADPIVRIWRGALDDERLADEARAPLAPNTVAVVCSTIDQVGSRLLFDGYGISTRSRPLHAGLIGIDSLIVLDEAHLADPFLQTGQRIADIQGDHLSLRGVRVLPITATPSNSSTGFALTQPERSENTVAQRLSASKPARLIPLSGKQPAAVTKAALPLLQKGTVTGVVMNTVRDAREVHDRLAEKRNVHALLVIGPARPIDRKSLLTQIPDRDQRAAAGHAIVVIGTQTLEVGLDLDFDALVTVCAPVPSLIQRFGRLDRFGASGHSTGVIVGPPKKCPVYGEATQRAWEWLETIGSDIDFGIDAMQSTVAAHPPPEPEPSPHTPLLLRPHVEALRMTSQRQQRPPEVALYLHGYVDETPELQIGWRADLTDHNHAEWGERVLARPPHPGELISLPLPAVRRWLADQAADAFSDLEGVPLDENASPRHSRTAVRILPTGPDGERRVETIDAARIRPGDVLLVPARYGGCDRYGWAPDSAATVIDLGNLSGRVRLLLRPSDPVAARTVRDVRFALDQDEITPSQAYTTLLPIAQQWLAVGADLPESHQRTIAAELTIYVRGVAEPVGDHDIVLVAYRAARRGAAHQVTYREHVDAVEEHATGLATSCGLPPDVVRGVRLAARYHDLGKLDPRFQAWLADGAQEAGEPLAKSAGQRSPRRIVAARDAAGWPHGKRHELVSAALLAHADLGTNVDSGLVRHLVTVHHGYGRPFLQSVDDEHPPDITAEIEGQQITVSASDLPDWAEHVQTLTRLETEFGIWGLAFLEAVLVLADRTVSATEGAA